MTGHGHGHGHIHHGGDATGGNHSVGDSGAGRPITEQSTKLLSSGDGHALKTRHEPTDHTVVIPPLDTKSSMAGRTSLEIPPFKTGMLASDQVPGSGKAGDVREAKINGSTPVGEILKRTGNDTVFVDKQSDANDKLHAGDVLKPGETAKIKVVYENRDTKVDPPPPAPDFVVKKDGTVECLHNPEKNPDANIVVQVERDAGQTGDPTDKQKESLAGLVPYLADRVANSPAYQKVSPDGNVAIEDNQNLVDPKVEAAIENNITKPLTPDVHNPPVPDVPTDAGNASGRMNRVGGSNGGHDSFSPSGDGAISSRDGQAPARDTTPPVQAVEDTISALAGVQDKAHPYDNVARRSDNSYGVGRYSMNQFNIGSWLGDIFGIDLGDPPDPAKLAALLAEMKAHPEKMKAAMGKLAQDGKVSKDFASHFDAGKFTDFVGKLDGKHGAISAQDVRENMPKDLQETIAQNRVEHYAKSMNIDPNKMGEKDPGKLALAMFLGRTPSEADLSNPGNQKYQDTANNMYKLALAGQFGSDRIDVSELNGKVIASAAGGVGQQLWAQTPWANACQGGNLGCAASVSKVLEQAGVFRSGEGSAGVEDLASKLQAKGYQRIQITDKSQFHTGDVVYGDNGGGNAHIGIIGEIKGGTVWSYDNSSSKTTWQHHTLEQGGSFVPGGRFGRNHLFVLRAPGSDQNNNVA